jgi:hypothetical protein
MSETKLDNMDLDNMDLDNLSEDAEEINVGEVLPGQIIIEDTFGRINPGTPGHLLLFDRMVQFAIAYIKKGGRPQIHFTLSQTQGGSDNPFFCEGTEEEKTYKKNIFIQMIIAMVSTKYPDQYFIINPDDENIRVNLIRPIPILIYVKCSTNIFSYLPSIIRNSESIPIVHLFFGNDQANFSSTIEKSLIKSFPGINIRQEILMRALKNGVDLKTLPVSDLCDCIRSISPDKLPEYCSSSLVKKLVLSNSPEACEAIHLIYGSHLDEKTIDNMITALYAILTAPPSIKSKPKSELDKPKSKVFKSIGKRSPPVSPRVSVVSSPKGSPTGSPRVSVVIPKIGSPREFQKGSPKVVTVKSPTSPTGIKQVSVVTLKKSRRKIGTKKEEEDELGGGKTRKNKRKNYSNRRKNKRNKKQSKRRK